MNGARICLAFLLAVAAAAAAQERTPAPGDVSTTVRVEVVLLDVLAVDGKDRPVLDLTKDDFDVRIGGKPQQLEGFEPPVKPVASAPAPELLGGSTVRVAAGGAPQLHVLFIVDLEELPPGAVVAAGKQALDFARAASGARIGLVTHYATNAPRLWDEVSIDRLETELSAISEDPALTVSGATRVTTSGPRGSTPDASPMTERGYEPRQRMETQLVEEIVHAVTEPRPSQARIDAAYRAFSAYLRSERMRVTDEVESLRGTLESFAALGDRRHAVLFSRGIERVPGAGAVAFLERALSDASSGRGGPPRAPARPQQRGFGDETPQALAGRVVWDGSPVRELDDLATFLASSGVTLHMVDPSAGADLPSAEHGFFASMRDRSGDRRELQDGASRLVSVTGGLMRANQGSIASFAETLSGSYRLAVRVSNVEPSKTYKVSVSARRRGVRILSRSAFRPAAPARQQGPERVEEAVRAAMRDERRPGAARLSPRKIPLTLAWKGKKGDFSLLEVRVPYDALGFVPEEDSMVASAKITVTPLPLGAADAEPVSEDVFLSLSGAEYSAAQGQELARTIKLSLPPGRYQLTVTIEDALLEKSAGVARLTVDAAP
jgi:hypothetical protein